MTDHRSPAAPSTGNPLSPHAADVLAWALGSPLPVPAEQSRAHPAEETGPATPVSSAPEEREQAGREAPATPESEPGAAEEHGAPAPEQPEAADARAQRPHAAPDPEPKETPNDQVRPHAEPDAHHDQHVGRAWGGTEYEDNCPCPKAPCGLVIEERADPTCYHHVTAAKTMRQRHEATKCPGPCPQVDPKEALRERARSARTLLHRLSVRERSQARDLDRTRERLTGAQAELLRIVGELSAMVEELTPAPAPAAPEPAPVEPEPARAEPTARPALITAEPLGRRETSPEEQRAVAPVKAAEEGEGAGREPLLRVLDNQAAEIHHKFGPYGPHPHTRTGDARTDWVASWLGSAPAARFRGEELTEDGWRRAPLTDPDGETSPWHVARTLATLPGGTPVDWAASGTVSVPGFRWTPVATARPFPAGGRIDWAREFTGATAPLAAPDSAWKREPLTATALGITHALRSLPAHVDVSERAGEIKAYAEDGVYRFTPRR